MQTITTELRLESGLLTKADNKGFKLEDNGGIRCNSLNDNTPGGYAFCAGYNGTASGYYSAHFGSNGTASNEESIHFGDNGTASGETSTHFGKYGTASGYCSTHFGGYGVASGDMSAHFGSNGTASGDRSTHFGKYGTASGDMSTHSGKYGTASGDMSTHSGLYGTASGYCSTHSGMYGVANRNSQVTISPGMFSAAGDAQFSILNMNVATTNATQTTMSLPEHFFIEDEKTYAITINVACRQDTGASHAYFKRQVLIERTGGTTSIVGTVQTIGTDINADSYGLAITADDTNNRLEIKVTGAASTNLRWFANIQMIELGYAN